MASERPGPAGAATARRRLTSAELAVWRSLLDTTGELQRRLGARMTADCGLSPSDYHVMVTLSEAPRRRLRPSALAEAMDWERSRLSHQLGRMEKRGLIRREECATDNRGSEIVLTDLGATAFRAATAPHARAIKEHFADALSADQFTALADVLTSLSRHIFPEREA
ncbi:MarR family winged helix-turn-helix transcriptional regulator [Streptomyces sp. NPDC051286]|uniref:MarR family winged helix-turn-helix transcriptional regulator n=1 Tax=Streptomyces sp. NPDC051286 TaxID=3365647 RepID=UPI0037A1BB6A